MMFVIAILADRKLWSKLEPSATSFRFYRKTFSYTILQGIELNGEKQQKNTHQWRHKHHFFLQPRSYHTHIRNRASNCICAIQTREIDRWIDRVNGSEQKRKCVCAIQQQQKSLNGMKVVARRNDFRL